MEGDPELMAALARAAVGRFAGMEPGRPVGGSYYVFKTLRQLQADALLARLLSSAQEAGGLEGLTLANEYRRRARALARRGRRRRCAARLVADRGAKAVARAARRPLPEDVDFMHLGKEELAALQRTVQPLARKLAVHLARKRRTQRRGAPRFPGHHAAFFVLWRRSGRPPVQGPAQRSKPELWVLADISGLRGRLRPLHAPARLRPVIAVFPHTCLGFHRRDRRGYRSPERRRTTLRQAVNRINTQADVIWAEGHSDYGHALSEFVERWGREVTARTTVLVLGDARNNYHSVQPWAIAELARRSRHVWWLNPEPRAYWDTGDSVLTQYGAHCTGVCECRNLRQLRHFIEQLPLAHGVSRPRSPRHGIEPRACSPRRIGATLVC